MKARKQLQALARLARAQGVAREACAAICLALADSFPGGHRGSAFAEARSQALHEAYLAS